MNEEQTQYEVKKFTENAIMLAMQLLEFAGWQPMETAPRDNTEVLLRVKGMWGIQIGGYSEGLDAWSTNGGAVGAKHIIGWLPLPQIKEVTK